MPTFNDKNDEAIYQMARDPDRRVDVIGTTDDLGWYARLDNVEGFDWIVAERRNGTVLVRQFERDTEGVKPAWTAILVRYFKFYSEVKS